MKDAPTLAPPLAWWQIATAAVAAAVAYWITFAFRGGSAAILVALPCLFLLSRVRTSRQVFYIGLATGIGMYAPMLLFFVKIFGAAAGGLYIIAALPIAIFQLLVFRARRTVPPAFLILLIPVLWTGIEFFRSELYQLRFAWLLPGQAVAFVPGVRMLRIGVYGLGFVFALLAALIVSGRWSTRALGVVGSLCVAPLMYWPALPAANSASPLHVAGVQLEFPTPADAGAALDRLAIAHPEAQVLVLSEYSFTGPVPQVVREVLTRHHRYLIAGGTAPLDNGAYYDTAFVIGPDGRDVFEQAKSVPVQFMTDGLPARERRVWESPWGKIGIAICYDVSYARVMDDFVRQGAAALIIPTEDARPWGLFERRMLHGRMAPVRCAEYGIPLLSVWSSGESQLVDRYGRVIATAGYPGQGEMIAGPLDVSRPGHVPPDRAVAMGMSVFTGAFAIFAVLRSDVVSWRRGDRRRRNVRTPRRSVKT